MYYLKGYSQGSRLGSKNVHKSARALIVFFVAMALLTSLPMTSPDAEGARMITTFDDGSESKIVEFTTDPLPGERATLYIKIRGDVTVTQAALNASAVLLERSLQAVGTGLTLLGYGIDVSGDYDGDGYTDLVVTAPGATNTAAQEGYLATVRGSATGFAFPVHIAFYSGTANNYMGWGLSTGGDLNKDGYDDVVTSRIEMDFATPAGTGTGDVLIHWGGTRFNTTADVTLSYGASGDMFGYSVSTHGDVNGDGNPDLVVGSPRNEVNTNNPGRAFIYYGTGTSSFPTTPNVTLTGTDNGDGFGRVVHICGDVNDDGVDDVFVGAPGHNSTSDFDVGKAYIFYGGASGVDTTADWTYVGKNEEDFLGFSGTGMSDVNDDGIDDFAIGVPLWDNGGTSDTGQALVFYGSGTGPANTPDVTIKGDTSNGALGVDMAHGGDINNDSLGDLVIGAPNTHNGSLTDAGHIQVHFGNSNGLSSTPEKILRGWVASADMGYSVGPGGDGNGDGYDDICTGDITGEFTYCYYGGPSAPSPAVYVDDVEIWSHSGSYLSTDRTDDFSDQLNAYIATHQGDVDVNGDLLVPINISMSAKGLLKINDMVVQFYKLVQPTNLAATAIPGGSAIKLTWDDHTSKGDDISKMAIEMWNGTGWEEIIKVAKNAKEYIVSGLEDGQSYSFRILAFDGGVQQYSEPSDVAIGVPGDTKPPDKVTGVSADEDRDLMGINVSWDPSDDDVVNYEVWSNKTGTWAVLANVSAPMTYYVDTTVDDGPRYYYKVRAWDEVPLVGDFSKIVWGVLYDLEPPVIPENLQVHVVPVGRALELSWDLNDDDTVAYSIESNKTGSWWEMALVGRSEDSYVDTGLSDGTRYYYRLRAKDESNNFSNYTAVASGVPVDSEPPMAPMGLEATPRSVGNILRLTWILNDDDTVGYHIYIFDDGASDWELVTYVAGDVNQYEVGDLENGVTYRIRIKAVDLAERESDWSNEATGIPADTHPPNIPQGLDAELDPNGGAANLSWDPNNDDTVAYNVLEWSGIDWVEIATVIHPEAWHYVDGLVNNQPYTYVVRAVDEADNESPNSKRVDVIPKDTVKPEPPVFVDIPLVTNQKDQVLTGYCEPYAKIITYLNLYPQDPVDCDEEGNFQVTVRLKNGPNEVYAEANDDAGTSDPSARHTIRVDLEGPHVESTNPADGTKGLSRLNFTWEVYFDEEVRLDSIKAYLTKGRVEHSTLVLNIGDPANIIPVLMEYNNVRSIATFEVMEELQSGSTYSILIYEVKDIAGNPLDHPNNAYSFYIETSASGGGGGGGGEDEGLGSIALYAGAGIVIILVIIIAIFLVSRSGTREEIEVDKSIMAAPLAERTPEQMRPDIDDLYAEAYDERGEGDTEHHEVEGGLGEWLSEQEKSSQEADIEAKRLMEEMAQGAPPPEDTGPISKVPPGLVEERAVPAYHMDSPETDTEVEAETDAEEAEAEEDAEEESEDEDDAAALLDELDEELSKDEDEKD